MSNNILVLGCYEHTVTIARSLARAGSQITLGVTSEQLEQGFVHDSRAVTSTWLHPDMVDQPSAFDFALLDYLTNHSPVDAIFPVGEDEIRKVAHIRSRLPDNVIVVMPSNDTVFQCLHKQSANQLADDCNIPTAGTRTVRSINELRQAVKELGFPAIAKPAESTSLLHNKKCVFIHTEDDLESLCSNWPTIDFDIIVQNEIVGTRHNCDIIAENGKIMRYFEAEILRTDQLDDAGNSVCDRSIPPNSLHWEYCERMVEALNYTGMALFQFLRNPHTGKTCFLEVNPRSGAAISLAVGCGMEMPAAALNACSDLRLDCEEQYPFYRRRHCLHDDLQGLRKARVCKEIGRHQSLIWLGRIFRDAVRADLFSTLLWSDPKPTVKIYWNMLLRLFARSNHESSRNVATEPVEILDPNSLAAQSSSASGIFPRIEPMSK